MQTWFSEVLRGKTYARAYLNEQLSVLLASCRGRWLDVGGGATPSYLRFLPAACERVATDIDVASATQVRKIDANESLPFPENSFDGVFAINMLYILRHSDETLKEMWRVVKPGGEVIATFPFFFPETPEPHDYHRWTKEGTEFVLREAGFTDISVEPIGGSWSAWGTIVLSFRGSFVFRILLAPLMWLGDHYCVRKTCVTYGWLVRVRKPS